MNEFMIIDDEQAEDQMLNNYLDVLDANKPSVYIKHTKMWDDEFQFIFTCSQKKQYEKKK